MPRLTLLLILILFGFPAYTQQYKLEHFTTSEGLVHPVVYRAIQDRRGFIWFSTDNGISQFDGTSFKNYTMEEGLLYNAVMSISEIGGEKYINTYKGGISILTDTGFSQLLLVNGNLPTNIIYSLHSHNILWIISISSKANLSYVKDRRIKTVISGFAVHKMRQFANEVLVTTDSGIYRVYNDTAIAPFLNSVVGKQQRVYDIQKDKKGGYWIGLKGKILYVKNSTVQEQYHLGSESIPADLLVDEKSDLWVTTSDLKVFQVQEKKILEITSKLGLQNKLVNDLMEDTEGNIWFSTYGDGVYKLNSTNIINYTPDNNKNIGVYCTTINPIDSNTILVGSIGHLSLLKDEKLSSLTTEVAPWEYIYCSYVAGNRLFIGTPYRLFIKKIGTPLIEAICQQHGAVSIYYTHDNKLLVGTYSNLYSVENRAFVRYDSNPIFNHRKCNSIISDRHNNLLVATDSGVIKFDGITASFINFPSLRPPVVTSTMLKDKYARIWLATPQGLVCFSDKRQIVYTIKNGLCNNRCNALFEDEIGQLWVGTSKGINIIDLKTLKIKEFSPEKNIGEVLSIYKRANKLFIGTIQGLTVMNNINDLVSRKFLPKLYITTVSAFDTNFNMPNTIRIDETTNKLQIEYSGLYYTNPAQVNYRYKLGDENWNYTTLKVIELSSLPSGEYDFLVNARVGKGGWSEGAILHIRKPTPIWKSIGFIIFCVFVILLGLFVVVKIVVTKKEYKKKEQLLLLNKITYLKQQALSALINPHFIFNCMNSIQHYINRKNYEQANIYLADFATLIRVTMEDVQHAFISLENEIKRINTYLSLEQLRLGDRLQYQILVSQEIVTANTYFPNMILQPYIENAIWHGIRYKKNGELIIDFSLLTENRLRITIEDNGVGISNNRGNNGDRKPFGMSLTRERLALLSKLLNQQYSVTVQDVNKKGATGTRIEIVIPAHVDIETMNRIESDFSK